MELQTYLKEIRKKGQRFFTLEQLMSDLRLSKNAVLNAIYRRKKHGDIISPAKGLYIIVPHEHQPYGSIPAAELIPILMKYLNGEYYVSLLSAAEFYGAAHQKSAKFQIITNKRIKHPLCFGQVQIDVIYKRSLNELPLRDFTAASGYLKIASSELIVYDLFHYLRRSGGLNHIATVLSELIESVDADNLIKLAEITDENAWLQRFGFVMEQTDTIDEQKTSAVTEAAYNFLSKRSTTFIPLAPEALIH
jgi:predicted transcriptional regulator of viral defense system